MNNLKKLQSGRSMVEMLGVLAIIGVLSIGGIAGYSMAMQKFRTNRAIEQVQMIMMNTRTVFAPQGDFKGLTNQLLRENGVLTEDMCGTDSTCASPKSSFGTAMTFTLGTNDVDVTLSVAGVPVQSCITMVTSSWGDVSSGMLGIKIGGAAEVTTLPLSVADATTACETGATNNTNPIAWRFR